VRRLALVVTAKLVIDRLCVPEGERASSWTTECRADHMFHAGFVIADGYEFVAALGGWTPHSPIRLLPDGGEWPYSFALAADGGRAMIEYCEGDIGVRVYDTERAYREALDKYARGEADR
jgi:hypothetical protein